jgi:hypothetical protein
VQESETGKRMQGLVRPVSQGEVIPVAPVVHSSAVVAGSLLDLDLHEC